MDFSDREIDYLEVMILGNVRDLERARWNLELAERNLKVYLARFKAMAEELKEVNQEIGE